MVPSLEHRESWCLRRDGKTEKGGRDSASLQYSCRPTKLSQQRWCLHCLPSGGVVSGLPLHQGRKGSCTVLSTSSWQEMVRHIHSYPSQQSYRACAGIIIMLQMSKASLHDLSSFPRSQTVDDRARIWTEVVPCLQVTDQYLCWKVLDQYLKSTDQYLKVHGRQKQPRQQGNWLLHILWKPSDFSGHLDLGA